MARPRCLRGIRATARNSMLTATGWPALKARAPFTSRRKASRRASSGERSDALRVQHDGLDADHDAERQHDDHGV
jgi:hypothetical protein